MACNSASPHPFTSSRLAKNVGNACCTEEVETEVVLHEIFDSRSINKKDLASHKSPKGHQKLFPFGEQHREMTAFGKDPTKVIQRHYLRLEKRPRPLATRSKCVCSYMRLAKCLETVMKFC